MSTEQLLQKTDIKLSVKQTFGFDSDIEFFGDLKTYSPSQGSDI